MDILLKRARLSDCQLIYAMQVRAFAPLLEKYKDYDTNPGAETFEKVKKRMEQSFTDYFLIELGGLSIGAIRIVRNLKGICRISPIFILPEFQGRGYAHQAIKAAEMLYPEVCRWELDTIKEEEKLCRLYESLGYTVTGREKELQKGMTLIYYIKQL
ncbi:MAG: GNAT family N-acetyltransferase [Clostridiaceae bacterium]|nr:GNAT family N-acetyltransferase [Clostridiaceae bacterium]